MNAWRAGAGLTTRSKRGSTGAPGTFGISARSGGSSAAVRASGWAAFCEVALSMSERTPWSTRNGEKEASTAAPIPARLVRFTVLLLLLAGVVGPRGRPVSLALDRRIELDGFSRLGPLQDDLLVADPHYSGVPVALPEVDGPAIDRYLVAVFRDDHDLRGRRARRGLVPVSGSAENLWRGPRGIAQSLRENPRPAERGYHRQYRCQVRSHGFSGLSG